MIDNKTMEPYRNLLNALLVRAIRDARSSSGEDCRSAWRWLRTDPRCVEICNWLELDHEVLLTAFEHSEAPVLKGA